MQWNIISQLGWSWFCISYHKDKSIVLNKKIKDNDFCFIFVSQLKTPTIWVTHLNLSLYLFYVLSFLPHLVLVPLRLTGITIKPIIRSPSKWWRRLFGLIEVTICCIISVPINVNKKRGTIVPLLQLHQFVLLTHRNPVLLL